MSLKSVLVCLLIGNVSYAQFKAIPTQFDIFINKPEIEWACYANDYLNFEKFNLNKILFLRFAKNEIKASYPVSNSTNTANNITYSKKEIIDEEMLYPICTMPIYDSNGNVRKLEVLKPYEIDTLLLTPTGLTQILYIENGILKSYVPWVSPDIVKVTTNYTKEFIGYMEYFSTCYNYKYDYIPKEKLNDILLTTTKRNFNLDSMSTDNRLKELYGRNLLKTLSPFIQNNNLEIFTADSLIKLNPTDIDNTIFSKINTLTVKEDYYDTLESRYIRYGYPKKHFDLEDFKEIQLVQDWYYNSVENIVFNKIRMLYLCAKKWTSEGEDKEASPILKIIFK